MPLPQPINLTAQIRRFFVVGLCLGLSACASAPFTGRQQLILLSSADEAHMGLSAFQQVLKNEKIVKDPKINQKVKTVADRIIQAANRPDFQWEVKVVDSPQKNAFCLPGGKIVVYSGILPITQDDAGLATVIGHEVAHALARHGAERVSQSLLAQGALAGANVALSNKSLEQQQGILSALGLGLQLGVLLPFSREHESEADRIGLILMAKAGYDPQSAIGLWERMSSSGAQQPPEFLSTHPSDRTRIRQIQAWVAEARGYLTGK